MHPNEKECGRFEMSKSFPIQVQASHAALFGRDLCQIAARGLYVSLLLTPVGVGASECDSILELGIRNTYQALKQANLRDEFNNSFCHKENSTGSQGKSGSLGFLGSVKIDLGANSQKASTVASETCDTKTGKLSDEGLVMKGAAVSTIR
jgi:hypothetical protein